MTLTLEQQAAFVEGAPEIFLPIPDGWGRMGHTHIRLTVANQDMAQKRETTREEAPIGRIRRSIEEEVPEAVTDWRTGPTQ